MILYEAYNMDINNPYTMKNITNLTWDIHFHRAYECIYVNSGELSCKIDHKVYHVTAGMLLFIMPNQLHSFVTPQASHCYILRFSPELIGHFHNSYLDKVPANSCISFFPRESIEDFYFRQKEKPLNTYALKALLYKICSEMVDSTAFVPRNNSSGDKLIYNLLDYIHKNYTGECSLSAAAEVCSCDYYHASKTFIKYTGISFVNYVNNLRLQKACYLIKNTDDSLLEISLNCGFSSLRSFNRNFLKFCGCTPSEYNRKGDAGV